MGPLIKPRETKSDVTSPITLMENKVSRLVFPPTPKHERAGRITCKEDRTLEGHQ